jgi:hypothetical protein
MCENKNNTITLIYCGKEFHHCTYNGNGVYRVFFINKQFTFYEFYTNGGSNALAFLSQCKNGTLVKVTWKRYGQTCKKIILDAELAKKETPRNA